MPPSPYKNDYKLSALGVNNNTRAIFDLMRSRMDEENIIHLSVKLKLGFMGKTSSKAAEPLDAFKTILRKLKQAGVIRFVMDGAYMINPAYGIKYENSGKKVHLQWVKLGSKGREPHSLMKGAPIPHEREPQSLQQGATVPPLSLVK